MSDLEAASPPTGERFVPEAMGDQLIEAEHHVRYRHAMRLVRGRRVLDAGCGVGWGCALLAVAGASTVVGLDIDEGALADAKERTNAATFVRGDLQRLPFADRSFDVVVCYEAIEHVADPHTALDELQRVLVRDGLLTVSSPNPDVYAHGNPFHVHEFRPEELRAELSDRFRHATVWQQHAMLASVLVSSDVPPDVPSYDVANLARLSMAAATYSVMDASDAAMEPAAPLAALVSGRQFAEMAEQLEAQRDHLSMPEENDRALEAVRVASAERDHFRSELDRTLLLLLEAEQELAKRNGRVEA
jgi:2-polyprenyl-3-methyl-5-hydroxy-6-metoxy-1,4-benzoquinol methylase